MRLIDAEPLETSFEYAAKFYMGPASAAFHEALESLQNATTVAAVPAEKYNVLKERYDKLMETANILDAALREYQRKCGE